MFKEVSIDDKVKILIAENFVRNINQSAMTFFVIWFFSLETDTPFNISTVIAISVGLSIIIKFFLGWLGDTHASRFFITRTYLSYLVSIVFLYIGILNNNTSFMAISVVLINISIGFRALISMKLIKENSGDSLGAISFGSMLVSFSPILGPILGSLLVESYQNDLIMLSLAMTILLATIHYFVVVNFSTGLTYNNEESSEYFKEMKVGIDSVMKVKPEMMMCLSTSIINFILLPVFVIFIPHLIYTTLQYSSWVVVAIDIGFALGLFSGSKWINKFSINIIGHFLTIILGGVLLSIFIVSSISESIYPLMIFSFLGGLGLAFININSSNLRIKAYPKEVLSRASNIISSISSSMSPFGVLLFGSIISTNRNLLHWVVLTLLVMFVFTLLINKEMFYMSKLSDEKLDRYYSRRYHV
ncbi:TPA: MFS transporter [Vibrio vulnificus]|nr:MFS transporter [Vibrio vulnificus]